MKLPKKLQPVLWSVNIDRLDSEKDKYYIIHQTLAFGNLENLIWLLSTYPRREIIDVFKVSFKDYSRPRFYLIKDAVLELKDWHPDERYYVKNTHRIVG